MSLVNDIKKLVANSPIFVEEAKLAAKTTKSAKKHKYGRDVVKIGQGGTLDPLADGVLGDMIISSYSRHPAEGGCSRGCRQRYEKAG